MTESRKRNDPPMFPNITSTSELPADHWWFQEPGSQQTPVEWAKDRGRRLVKVIEAYTLATNYGALTIAMSYGFSDPWDDHWSVYDLSGRSLGDILIDASGTVVKGDALSELVYHAETWAERTQHRVHRSGRCPMCEVIQTLTTAGRIITHTSDYPHICAGSGMEPAK